MSTPFKRIEPKWWPSRGAWLVRHGGHTTQFEPIVGSKKAPPAALALCDTFNAALETGGMVVDAETGTLAAVIEIFCKQLDQRRDVKQSITPKYCRDTKRNARAWKQVRTGFEGTGRNRKPIFAPRMYNGKQVGDLMVRDLEVADVTNIFADLDGGYKTKKNKIEALRCAIDCAVNLGWCNKVFARGDKGNTSNAARAVKHEQSTHATTEAEAEMEGALERIQTPDIARLCDEVVKFDRPRYKQDKNSPDGRYNLSQVAWCDGIAVVFAIHTNLRFGEQAALKWKYVDFDNSLIWVRTAAREGDAGVQTVGVTKTKQSRRSVFMTPTLKKLLAEWKMRSPWSGDEDRVFVTREGNRQVSSDNWRTRVLHRACDNVGMPRCTWHQLRHMFASIAIAMHKPSRDRKDDTWSTLATLMGHKTPAETYSTYVHWINDLAETQQMGNDFDAHLRGVA